MISQDQSAKRIGFAILFVIALAIIAVATNSFSSGPGDCYSPEGTMCLDSLKLGTPEAYLKRAFLTFASNKNSAARAEGRTLYLSRSTDSNGGFYLVECAAGQCCKIDIFYDRALSINEEMARDVILPRLLPDNLLDKRNRKSSSNKDSSLATSIKFDDKYIGTISYYDKTDVIKSVVASKTVSLKNSPVWH